MLNIFKKLRTKDIYSTTGIGTQKDINESMRDDIASLNRRLDAVEYLMSFDEDFDDELFCDCDKDEFDWNDFGDDFGVDIKFQPSKKPVKKAVKKTAKKPAKKSVKKVTKKTNKK